MNFMEIGGMALLILGGFYFAYRLAVDGGLYCRASHQ